MSGDFSDSYTFSLALPNTVNVLLSSVVGGSQNVDFSSVTVTGPSGVFSAVELTGDAFESWALGTPVLDPGIYTLTATGRNSDAVGSETAPQIGSRRHQAPGV